VLTARVLGASAAVQPACTHGTYILNKKY
jgi:hypothetical protein